MTISLTTFQSTVDGIISASDNELSAVNRNSMVKAAVERYSHDLPDEITTDVTGDGGRYYGVAAKLTSWSEGFSQVISIEYPAATIANDESVTLLDPEDWDDDYWATAVRYLYLPNHAPAATEAMRVRYTAPYAWTAGVVDIPPAHFYAVSLLAAGLTAQSIAQKYSRTSDSTISVDSVDHLSRAQQWSERARELIKAYRDELNLGDEGMATIPAGEFVDWDTSPSGNRRYLYHGDR